MRGIFKLVALNVLIIVLGFNSTVKATTYNVSLNAALPDGVNSGPGVDFASTFACVPVSCAGDPTMAVTFTAKPGDTINFGTLTLFGSIFGGREGREYYYVGDDGLLHDGGFGFLVALYPGKLFVSSAFQPFVNLFNGWYGECNTADPTCIPRLEAANRGQSFDLTFNLAEDSFPGVGFIEFAWTSPFSYTPPPTIGAVPEPSTWAMLLIGFAGIGLATYRRHRPKRNRSLHRRPAHIRPT